MGGVAVAVAVAMVVLVAGCGSDGSRDAAAPQGVAPGGVVPIEGFADRQAPAVAAVGDRLLVFGGQVPPPTGRDTKVRYLNDGVLVDPTTGAAEQLPDPPFDKPLAHPIAQRIGGRVLVLGSECIASEPTEGNAEFCEPDTYAVATFDPRRAAVGAHRPPARAAGDGRVPPVARRAAGRPSGARARVDAGAGGVDVLARRRPLGEGPVVAERRQRLHRRVGRGRARADRGRDEVVDGLTPADGRRHRGDARRVAAPGCDLPARSSTASSVARAPRSSSSIRAGSAARRGCTGTTARPARGRRCRHLRSTCSGSGRSGPTTSCCSSRRPERRCGGVRAGPAADAGARSPTRPRTRRTRCGTATPSLGYVPSTIEADDSPAVICAPSTAPGSRRARRRRPRRRPECRPDYRPPEPRRTRPGVWSFTDPARLTDAGVRAQTHDLHGLPHRTRRGAVARGGGRGSWGRGRGRRGGRRG